MSASVDAVKAHEVYGLTRAEVASRIGDLRQIARIDSFTEEQWPAHVGCASSPEVGSRPRSIPTALSTLGR